MQTILVLVIASNLSKKIIKCKKLLFSSECLSKSGFQRGASTIIGSVSQKCQNYKSQKVTACVTF
jgi:hypothetical protein